MISRCLLGQHLLVEVASVYRNGRDDQGSCIIKLLY
jgi:hypothetical protein